MRDAKQPLSEERIAAYLRGELSARDRAAVEEAIDRDPQWLTVVALLAREDGPRGSATDSGAGEGSTVDRIERQHAARLRPGAHLGRYEVEGLLGRGGMGMVYAARDPELDRRVALKLLRGGDRHDQARLLREARALARLSDRHVITIHDVGTWEGRVFLAMELLDGQTLAAWRAERPRTWSQVLASFVDAGRGLAAAHAAGLVHRDFKPANVMLTVDGRVVVLDFGLAHAFEGDDVALDGGIDADDADDEHDEPSVQGRPRSADAEGSLTRTGQRLGTPAYMAPEQQRGEYCGPRTDQFSFCLALHEALYGRLPARATVPHRPASFDAATGRVPRRVARLIEIGLAPEPAKRHPSMDHLVDGLAAVLRPRRRRAALVLVAGLSGAAAAWALLDPPPPELPSPCTGSAAAMEETWNDGRAAAVARALSEVGLPWSARVRDEVDRRLRRYADAWVVEHEATCRAARIDGVDSEAVLELRMLCLDRHRRSLDALAEVLTRADVEVAAHAIQAADGLPSLSSCRDVEALRAPIALPEGPERRAEADALFDQLARVEALRQSTRTEAAAALAEQAVRRAVTLGHEPTEADARLVAGWVRMDRGEHDAAEAELRAALHAAEAGRYDEGITRAWSRLAWVVGYKLARFDEGRQLAEHAEAWSRRSGQARYHELSRRRTLGWIEHEAGNVELALSHFEAAVADAERLPPDDPSAAYELALALNGVGAAALGLADLPRAAEAFERAASQLSARLGPEHPDVAAVRNNLASLLRAQGKVEEARRSFEHNLGVFSATFGEGHVQVAQTLINLAVTELDLGRHADAAAHAGRGIEVLTAALGPRHPLVAKAHTIRGDARTGLGQTAEAIEDFELALALELELLGPEHLSVGIIESNLGNAYYDLGRLDESAEHLTNSVAILEAAQGADHPNLAVVLVSLGITRRAQGRRDEAMAMFRRADAIGDATVRPNALTRIGEGLLDEGKAEAAVEIIEEALRQYAAIEYDPGFAGDAHFALARARWASDPGSAGAGEAAQAAIEAYVRGGDTELEQEVRRWTAEHPPAAGRG